MLGVFELQNKAEYILTAYTGDFNMETAKRGIGESLQACSQHKVSAVLLDCREMISRLSVLGRYQVVIYGKKIIGAVVLRVVSTLPSPFVLFVTRAGTLRTLILD